MRKSQLSEVQKKLLRFMDEHGRVKLSLLPSGTSERTLRLLVDHGYLHCSVRIAPKGKRYVKCMTQRREP